MNTKQLTHFSISISEYKKKLYSHTHSRTTMCPSSGDMILSCNESQAVVSVSELKLFYFLYICVLVSAMDLNWNTVDALVIFNKKTQQQQQHINK